jgi:hypothetical protein
LNVGIPIKHRKRQDVRSVRRLENPFVLALLKIGRWIIAVASVVIRGRNRMINGVIEELMDRVRVFLENEDSVLISDIARSMCDADPFELAVAVQKVGGEGTFKIQYVALGPTGVESPGYDSPLSIPNEYFLPTSGIGTMLVRIAKHDPRSIEIFKALEDIDFNRFNDYFCWKSGGEGDNGEVFLTQLDIYFRERVDQIQMASVEDLSRSLLQGQS